VASIVNESVMRFTTDVRARHCRCDSVAGTVLAGIGSNSNITTGAGTAAEPLLAVGPGQLGQHSSYVNLLGNTPGSFQSKNDMSPAQTREKAISGGSTLVGETASLMPPSASSSGPTPRYGSVGHIVDNSLPSQLQYVDLTYTVEDSTGAVQGEAKQILKGMTFEIQRGTMFAIMGPSGAGKTTLLGILGMRTMRGDLEFTRFTKVGV
jgi:ABC-type multidrug transport system fused ATPase/permease subunit